MSGELARRGATALAGQQPAQVPPPGGLTREQKAAIILSSLGEEQVKQVMERLEEHEVRAFARAMSALRKVPVETLGRVAAEFAGELGKPGQVQGGAGQARAFLARFMDEAAVGRIMAEVEGGSTRSVWEKLSAAPDDALAAYLARERPQTAAVILSRLDAEKAAAVVAKMGPEKARDIVTRMARAPKLDDAVLDAVGEALERDFLAAMEAAGQGGSGPAAMIGAMLNNLSMDLSAALLEHLKATDEGLAAQVQKMLFTFEDIPVRLEPLGIQAVIRATDTDVLLKALKLARDRQPEVVEALFANMSKRVGEQVREDLDAMGPIRAREAEDARAEMARTAQRLIRSGEIALKPEVEEGAEEEPMI
ncbi:MAG: hypothetical protein LPL00_09750 [Alphaproteobacteria bacterium]|nr:hypothetical protein [Alphaproteobacteria bacterium]MDX5369956.1 hypothetical protein [Alphaproteobacteria bacterium]MDX5464531.1 hypothetical protein [Alphaproteobacteria bacterium]